MSEARFHSGPRWIADRPWAQVDPRETSVSVYYSGDCDEAFHVTFEPPGGSQFGIWTSAKGLRAIVDACQAALVRAEA